MLCALYSMLNSAVVDYWKIMCTKEQVMMNLLS